MTQELPETSPAAFSWAAPACNLRPHEGTKRGVQLIHDISRENECPNHGGQPGFGLVVVAVSVAAVAIAVHVAVVIILKE